MAGEATDFGCVRRSDLGRVCNFWCWNDLEWTGCSRVTGHRTETTVIFFLELGAVPMRGSRRWRQNGLYCKAYRPWPAREDSSTRELASPKLVSATAHTQQCDWRCEIAINESKKMAALARREQLAALARSEHERAARSLPAAALPQRAFSENTTKRDIPTFVRARIREFEAVLPRPFYLWSVRRASRWRHRLASTASRRSSRVDGVTALVRRRRASAS